VTIHVWLETTHCTKDSIALVVKNYNLVIRYSFYADTCGKMGDFFKWSIGHVRILCETKKQIPCSWCVRLISRRPVDVFPRTRTSRPVESHSGAQGNILAGPSKHVRLAPLGKIFLEFFFSKWCILVYFCITERRRATKRRGARGSLPSPTRPSRRAWEQLR